MSGLFITLEGGEGAGKSTHAKRLAQRLTASGHNVTLTREPGGTAAAESVRGLLVSGDTQRWSAEAEALLNYAARDAHLRQLIRPALDAGGTVISDRFMDSTRAYQGYAGGCDMALIDMLERTIVGVTRPRLTLVFDLNPDEGLARAKTRGDGEDRYERKGLAFHRKLRDGFLAIAKADPERCRIIDTSGDKDETAEAIWAEVKNVL